MNQLETLTQINLDDLVVSFGWQYRPILSRTLRRLFHYAARRFAEVMIEFDNRVGECGLAEAARLSQSKYVRDVRVFGLDLIPDSAFLALSNHPGMTDTLALFASLDRADLKIIALDRPFLRCLPNISRQLFYVQDEAAARMGLVRQVSSHLRAGGTVLTFPAGHIEPDPDVYPGAVDSLQSWTDSTGVFIRMSPATPVLPIVIRGVVWEKTAHHPLLILKKTRKDKENLAAAFQFLAQVTLQLRPIVVRVQIGQPIYPKDLGTTDTTVIHQAVLMEMKRLLECPPEGEGTSVL